MTSPLDTLTSKDVKQLLSDKYILIIGDSVVRGLYKDLIKFSNVDDFLNEKELRVKGEKRFYGDQLINGGVQKGLTNGIDYEEVREHTAGGLRRIRFYFLTRCYSSYMKNIIFTDIKNQAIKPDIIIMNSCLWDISRYGIYAMKSYQQNIDRIMGSFRQMLPDALFLWISALPVSNSSNGGVIISSAEYIRPILPGLIRDGNYYCSQMCNIHNVLYIDVHTIFSNMLHLRQPDGIHWSAIGNRIINEIILNYIKAYYHGVRDFKCLRLRAELGNKINTFKKRIKDHNNHLKINYLDQDILDDENKEDKIEQSSSKKTNNDNNNLSKLKRKRNNDDNEKENDQHHRKVIIKSTIIKNEQQRVAIKKSINEFEIKQGKLIDNQTTNFNHEYCDIMYDNEFEGLHLLHFSSCDIETSEDIKDFQLSNNIIEIQNQQTINNNLQVDIKPSENISMSMSLARSNDEKRMIDEPDYIILSSDDENETITRIVPSSSTTTILPIYLLNRLE
ncbi:unnamed protein product [Rotaria sordida]|uniref:Uncharacterized protein n=1 Tax=Rotaria sordida TaxID=392033 RepID=A0A819LWW2_9BILA|nr:unnamed protein product [Rotaria sordida]CAF3969386.1 unnamed protein product [Rotaria sordida]